MAAINKRKLLESAQRNLQKGALDKAAKDYQSVLEADPRDSNVRLKLGDLQLRRGQNDEAIACYLKVADQFMRDGFDAKAVAIYKQVSKIDPKRHDIHLPLADLYQRLGLASEAMGALQTAADAFHRAGRKREALELLRRMASLDPANVPSRLKVADLLRQEGLEDEALAEYGEAAAELERQGDWEARIGVLERILEIRPDRAEALEALATILADQGKARRAEPIAARLVEVDAERPEAHELFARILAELGQDERAVVHYKKSAEGWRARGIEERAREIMQRYVPAQPFGPESDPHVASPSEAPPGSSSSPFAAGGEDLGGGYGPRGQAGFEPPDPFEDGPPGLDATPDASAGVAAERNPFLGHSDADQLVVEANVYLRYGKHARAIESLEEALARDPRHAAALEALGEAHVAAGTPARATEVWTEAVRLAVAAGEAARAERLRARLAELDPRAAADLAPRPAARAEAPPTVLFDLDGELENEDGAGEDELELREDVARGEGGHALGEIEIDLEQLEPDGEDETAAPDLRRTDEEASDAEALDVPDAFDEAFDERDGSAAFGQPRGPDGIDADALGEFAGRDEPAGERAAPGERDDEIDLAGEQPGPMERDEEIDLAAELGNVDWRGVTQPPARPETLARPEPPRDEGRPREEAWELSFGERSPRPEPGLEPPHAEPDAVHPPAQAGLTGARAEAPRDLSDRSASGVAEDLEEAGFYFEQGLLDEAEAIYRRILARAPRHPGALLRLGEIVVQRGGDPGTSLPPAETSDTTERAIDAASTPETGGQEIEIEWPETLDLEPPDALDLTGSGPGGDADAAAPPPLAGRELAVEGAADEEEPDATARAASPAFDLAAELSEALSDTGSARAGLTATDEDGIEALFREFKRGVSRTLDEGDVETHLDLGVAYREMGLLEDAIGEFRHGLARPERRLHALHMMALCALDLGRPQDAVAHLEQALAAPELPDDREAPLRFDLARALAALGDRARALVALRRVAELDASFQDVAQRIEELERGAPVPEPDLEAPAEEADPIEAYESFDDLIAEAAEEDASPSGDDEAAPAPEVLAGPGEEAALDAAAPHSLGAPEPEWPEPEPEPESPGPGPAWAEPEAADPRAPEPETGNPGAVSVREPPPPEQTVQPAEPSPPAPTRRRRKVSFF